MMQPQRQNNTCDDKDLPNEATLEDSVCSLEMAGEEENAGTNAHGSVDGVAIGRVADTTAAAARGDDLPFSLRCWPCRRFILSMPRTSALLLGVVCPLFLLILISIIFGYILAQLEGPREMMNNNGIIEARIASSFAKGFTMRMTTELPAICTCTYFRRHRQKWIEKRYANCLAEEEMSQTAMSAKVNNTQKTNITGNSTTKMSHCVKPPDLQQYTIEAFVQESFLNTISCKNTNQNANEEIPLLRQYKGFTICNNETRFNAFIEPINPNAMMEFLNDCGQRARAIVDKKYRLSDFVDEDDADEYLEDLAASELTFNWIVCSRKSFEANTILNPFLNHTKHRPAVQEALVMKAVSERLNDSYCEYVDEIQKTGKSLTVDITREAIRHSFEEALKMAHELDQCSVNSWAGAWFW